MVPVRASVQKSAPRVKKNPVFIYHRMNYSHQDLLSRPCPPKMSATCRGLAGNAVSKSMLVFLRERIAGRTTGSGRPAFSKAELSLILGIYSRKVQGGQWRDYAIDSLPDMAVFSVFRASHETPLYAIAKYPSRSLIKPSRYVVYCGQETIAQGTSLGEVLAVFAED